MFKIIRCVVVLLAVGLLTACQTSQMTAVYNKQAMKPKPHHALVVFMRTSLFGGTFQSSVYDGKKYIGTLSSGMRIAYQAKPGKHMFMVIGESTDFMRAYLRANKTYYAIVVARPGFMKTRFSFRPQNGQISQSDIDGWVADTKLVQPNEKGYAWARANNGSIMQKRADDIIKWMNKPNSDKQTLHAKSGR